MERHTGDLSLLMERNDQTSFTRGRKFSSNELHIMLLALLETGPSHGYELIKALQSRSGGFWKPSPGMLYPALSHLEDLGYARVSASNNKKSYALLPDGLRYLNQHRDQASVLLAGLAHMARKMKYLQGAIADSDEAAQDNWLPEFVRARLAFKRALLLKSAADAVEQRRVTAILERATREINQFDQSINGHSS